MAEQSLEDQVFTLQARLDIANARISDLEAEVIHPLLAYSGTEMIQALLKSTHEDLTANQFKQLTEFLFFIRQHEPTSNTDLQASISKLLDDFYTAEPVLSQRPQDELVRPSGIPSAMLGLIMHFPSQSKSCHAFFDYQNPSVKLLMDKGITASNSYSFDWHWRSEGHERHRTCPVRGYSIELRSIHEVMTCNLIEALPLPLLVISGSCAWKNYLKTLSPRARHIKVPIRPSVYCSLVLDFGSTGLRRISCYIPHPKSLFYNKTLEWEADSLDLALRIDCSLNLVLELIGLSSLDTGSHFLNIVRKNPKYRLKHLTTTLSQIILHTLSNSIIPSASSTCNKAQQPSLICNGFAKCHAYVREEQNLGKHLTLNQYDQNFIDWALQIYGVTAEDVLEKGESLAVTIKWIMVDRVSAANKARRQVDRIVKANTIVKSEDEALVKSKDKTTVKSEHKKNPPLSNNSGYQEHRSCKRAYITLHEAYNNINIVATVSAAKRLRIGPKDSRKPRNRIEHELWHSSIVKVWASGDIYFWILSEDTRLGIRMGAKLGSKLKARVVDNIDDPRECTIEFALDGIRIKYGNDVIWHK